METHNQICFEIIMQELDSLFDYTSQEDKRLKLLNIDIIKSEHGISIYHTYHIINNTNQWYWGTKKKYGVKPTLK